VSPLNPRLSSSLAGTGSGPYVRNTHSRAMKLPIIKNGSVLT
jgi:hypothetical protein